MDQIFSIINDLGSPYLDLIWVSLLSVISYLFVSVFARLFEKKPEKVEQVTEEILPETPIIEDDQQIIEPEEKGSEFTPPIETEEVIAEEIISPEEGVSDSSMFQVPEVTHEQKVEEEKVVIEEELPEVRDESEDEPELSKEGLFSRLKQGLSKTHTGLFGKLDSVFTGREIDSGLWDEFEESLISADIGVATTMKLRESIESKLSKQSLTDSSLIKSSLKDDILEILKSAEGGTISFNNKPTVLMVAGVNGVGKTTTIGKLASKFAKDGKKVMVAAADTFRAAAVEQLEVWANRVGSDFIKGSSGADPSAVAFDSVQASISRGTDVLIIDTAGRLHTKSNLMDELKKIKRVVGREMDNAPHEVLLVLDATTGQNAVQQAKNFNEALDLTGIILTKLDGTAKGGVIIAIADELNIPVKYIGIGESLSDLREFNAEEFTEALFLTGEESLH